MGVLWRTHRCNASSQRGDLRTPGKTNQTWRRAPSRRSSESDRSPQLLATFLELPAAGGRRSGLSGGQEKPTRPGDPSDQSIQETDCVKGDFQFAPPRRAHDQPRGTRRACPSFNRAGQWHVLPPARHSRRRRRGRWRADQEQDRSMHVKPQVYLYLLRSAAIYLNRPCRRLGRVHTVRRPVGARASATEPTYTARVRTSSLDLRDPDGCVSWQLRPNFYTRWVLGAYAWDMLLLLLAFSWVEKKLPGMHVMMMV